MAGIFFTLLTLLSLSTGLEVLFPAGGNIWNLDQVKTYKIVWKSAITDPSHLHAALHDGAGRVIDSYERVKTESGSYLISGLSGITSGSDYRIVMFDASTPDHKIIARSGKFSIRQVADSASSGIIEDLPTSAARTTTFVDSTTQVYSPIFTEGTSTPSTPQTTSKSVRTTSKASQSRTGSTRTSTSTQTSTGFPKYVIPGQRRLSAGAKVGIGVGVALLVLTGLGFCLFFWRRRQQHHAAPEMAIGAAYDGHGAEAGYHGKPELVGDEARAFEHGPGIGYVAKPELETHSSFAGSSESNDQGNDIQPVPMGVAELPQRTNAKAVPVGVVELPRQSLGETTVHDRTVAEMDSTSPNSNHYGTDNSRARPLYGKGNESYQHQYQHQNAVELPVSSGTTVARKSIQSSPSSTAQPLSRQKEPPTIFTTQTAPSPLPPSPPSSTAPAATPALYPIPPLLPQETAKDDELEALRRRERSIAESISAAEALERLRREHLEIQERIRIAK